MSEEIFFIRLIPLDRPSQVWFETRLVIFSALVLTAVVFTIVGAVAIPTWAPREGGEAVEQEQRFSPTPPPAPSDFDVPVPSFDGPVAPADHARGR